MEILQNALLGLTTAKQKALSHSANIVNAPVVNQATKQAVQISFSETAAPLTTQATQQTLATVDITEDVVGLKVAAHSYKASAALLNVEDDLDRELFDILS